MWSPQPEGIPPPGVDSNPPRIQQVLTEKLPPLLPSPIPANTWAPLPDRSPLFKTKNMREMHSWLFENITFKCKYVSAALTENGHEHGQQQQRMCGKHRNSCYADGQRQQQTPEGTLHTYNRTRGQHFRHLYRSPVLEKEKTNTASLWHLLHLSLAYDFHEDLLPVLTRLEASLQRRGLRESCELLLDEVLPLQEIGIRLKWGFSLVCGLTREEEEERERELRRCGNSETDGGLSHGDEETYRFEGHGQPADLPSMHSHRSMGQLPWEQVGFRERVALRMKKRQNGR